MLRANSIERLLLVHGLMSLILVAASTGIGGGLVYFQQQATAQSIRETDLQSALLALRGDLYLQIKEVYDRSSGPGCWVSLNFEGSKSGTCRTSSAS